MPSCNLCKLRRLLFIITERKTFVTFLSMTITFADCSRPTDRLSIITDDTLRFDIRHVRGLHKGFPNGKVFCTGSGVSQDAQQWDNLDVANVLRDRQVTAPARSISHKESDILLRACSACSSTRDNHLCIWLRTSGPLSKKKKIFIMIITCVGWGDLNWNITRYN